LPTDPRFARVVSLACHDLRTPLATIYGFARTLTRVGDLDERTVRFLGMIEQAAEQMTDLLDGLGVAARIVDGRWEPGLREVDTLELATCDDERVVARGTGMTIETEADQIARSLCSLGVAAVRYGGIERVTWDVDGRTLALSPIADDAAPVLMGHEVRDLGSLVAQLVIGELGGSVALDGSTLRVLL
jgi:signal transduction histidine kinase